MMRSQPVRNRFRPDRFLNRAFVPPDEPRHTFFIHQGTGVEPQLRASENRSSRRADGDGSALSLHHSGHAESMAASLSPIRFSRCLRSPASFVNQTSPSTVLTLCPTQLDKGLDFIPERATACASDLLQTSSIAFSSARRSTRLDLLVSLSHNCIASLLRRYAAEAASSLAAKPSIGLCSVVPRDLFGFCPSEAEACAVLSTFALNPVASECIILHSPPIARPT